MSFSEKFGVSVMFLILAVFVAAFLTSSNNYLEVTRFNVLDARQGEPVGIDYDRIIKRDFRASWVVDLYRGDVWIATAHSPRVHTYRATAVLPEEIDLAWLTLGHPDFVGLDCGDYGIAVRWLINPGRIITLRTVEVRDKFKVSCDEK